MATTRGRSQAADPPRHYPRPNARLARLVEVIYPTLLSLSLSYTHVHTHTLSRTLSVEVTGRRVPARSAEAITIRCQGQLKGFLAPLRHEYPLNDGYVHVTHRAAFEGASTVGRMSLCGVDVDPMATTRGRSRAADPPSQHLPRRTHPAPSVEVITNRFQGQLMGFLASLRQSPAVGYRRIRPTVGDTKKPLR